MLCTTCGKKWVQQSWWLGKIHTGRDDVKNNNNNNKNPLNCDREEQDFTPESITVYGTSTSPRPLLGLSVPICNPRVFHGIWGPITSDILWFPLEPKDCLPHWSMGRSVPQQLQEATLRGSLLHHEQAFCEVGTGRQPVLCICLVVVGGHCHPAAPSVCSGREMVLWAVTAQSQALSMERDRGT